MSPELLLEFLLYNQGPISARWLHRELEIRQPYNLWLSRKIKHSKELDDYCFVVRMHGRDCELSPTLAISTAAGGGSKKAAILSVKYCSFLADVVFKDRNPLEVFDTALKCHAAEELLTRSFDPEPIPTQEAEK